MTCSEDGTTTMGLPLPSSTAELQICEHCDTVYRRRRFAAAKWRCCTRCRFAMERYHRLGPNGLLAMTVTAMVVFVQANIWPIVTLQLNGRPSSTTLWGTIIAMWQQHAQLVSVIAAALRCSSFRW